MKYMHMPFKVTTLVLVNITRIHFLQLTYKLHTNICLAL